MRRVETIAFTKQLAAEAQVIGVLGGGHAALDAVFAEQENAYELRMRLPGILPERFTVEVVDQYLVVHYRMSVMYKNIPAPQIVHMMRLPSLVDRDRIGVQYVENWLVVDMPKLDKPPTYRRRISPGS